MSRKHKPVCWIVEHDGWWRIARSAFEPGAIKAYVKRRDIGLNDKPRKAKTSEKKG